MQKSVIKWIFDHFLVKFTSRLIFLQVCSLAITVKDGQKITQHVLGEHKVITTEQQFLGVILSFFMHLRWPWLLRLFAVLL